LKENEVPQDKSKMMDDCRELCYAVDESGKYTTVKSCGWEVKQIVNDQAWELVKEKVNDIRERVLAGELSPLAYYMAKNQMDLSLLSDYTGFSKRKIKKHLDPGYYNKLDASILERYAKVFSMTVDELKEMG
jgi:hypothetical protein